MSKASKRQAGPDEESTADAREAKKTARLEAYAAKEQTKIDKAAEKARRQARRRGPAAARAAAQMSPKKRKRAEAAETKKRARLESAAAKEQAKIDAGATKRSRRTVLPLPTAAPETVAEDRPEDGAGTAVAPPDLVAAARPQRQRRRSWAGIEVDGTTVRVVEIDGDEIVWFHTYQGNSASYALEQWRSSVRRRARRPSITWAGTSSHFQRLEVPSLPEKVLGEYVSVNAAESLPLEAGAYVTAAVQDSHQGLPRVMSVVAVEAAALHDLWNFLDEMSVELVPAEFTLGAEGLFLAARNSCVVLVLVDEGVPVAARELACGGLDVLGAQPAADSPGGGPRPSGEGETLPVEGLDAVVPALVSPEPGAGESTEPAVEFQDAADAYVQELVSEVRTTTEFWQSQGLSVPAEMFVLGAGATLPGLHERFEDASIRSAPAPPPTGIRNLEALPDTCRLAYFGAVGAVVNAPILAVHMANPLVITAKAKAKLIGRRLRIAVTAAVAAALIGWFAVAPVLQSNEQASEAEAERQRTLAELGDLGERYALYNELREIEASLHALHADEPDWRALLDALFITAPEGTEFQKLTLAPAPCPDQPAVQQQPEQHQADGQPDPDAEPDPGCISAEMNTSLPTQDFLLAADWIRNLENISGFDVMPGTLSVSADEVVRAEAPLEVQFTLRLPNEGAFRTPRNLLGGDR